jgi:hypothetical protein
MAGTRSAGRKRSRPVLAAPGAVASTSARAAGSIVPPTLAARSSSAASVTRVGVTGPRAQNKPARPHRRQGSSPPWRLRGRPFGHMGGSRSYRSHDRIRVLANAERAIASATEEACGPAPWYWRIRGVMPSDAAHLLPWRRGLHGARRTRTLPRYAKALAEATALRPRGSRGRKRPR